jgi:hypothetical protein
VWFQQQGTQDPAIAQMMEEAAAVRPAHREDPGAPKRLTIEQLEQRTARRVELDDPNFAGTLTEEDLKIASSSAFDRLVNSGQVYRDLGGLAPRSPSGER